MFKLIWLLAFISRLALPLPLSLWRAGGRPDWSVFGIFVWICFLACALHRVAAGRKHIQVELLCAFIYFWRCYLHFGCASAAIFDFLGRYALYSFMRYRLRCHCDAVFELIRSCISFGFWRYCSECGCGGRATVFELIEPRAFIRRLTAGIVHAVGALPRTRPRERTRERASK